MEALVYEFSPLRWLLARHVGQRANPSAQVAFSGLSLRQLSLPAVPGPGWVPLRVRLAGICGTDLATLTGKAGPQLSPFVSFPAVLGHEVLAVPEEGPLAGRRVVLDPLLGCVTRGLPPCAACAQGRPALCHRFAEGRLAPGMLLGYCRDLPGAWSERMLAHESQIHPVPDGLNDECAVLAEPLAVALHAVLAQVPRAGERVLIIGAGTLGQCLVAAVRLLSPEAHTVVVARRPFQAALATRLGAQQTVRSLREAQEMAQQRGWGASFPGLLGTNGFTGGFDQVLDAVGSPDTLGGALRLTRAGGRFALIGSSGIVPHLDLTWLWAHEISAQGFCTYGPEPRADGRHTIALALELMAQHPEVPISSMVTHRFPLAAYRDALRACFGRRRSSAVKVLLEPAQGH